MYYDPMIAKLDHLGADARTRRSTRMRDALDAFFIDGFATTSGFCRR